MQVTGDFGDACLRQAIWKSEPRHCLVKKPEGLRKHEDADDPDDDNIIRS